MARNKKTSKKTAPRQVEAAEELQKPPRDWKGFGRALAPAMLSAALLYIAFAPVDFGVAAWVALVPLLVVIAKAPARRAIVVALIAGYAFFVVSLHWLGYVTYAGWWALAFYCALYWPLAAWLLGWLRRRGLPFTLTVPILLAALEFIRANFLTGFPFVLMGHTQHKYLPVIQIAHLTGVYGVTAFLGLINGFIADVALTGFKLRANADKAVVVVLAYVALHGYGLLAIGNSSGLPMRTPYRRILMVQGNIPSSLKHSPEAKERLKNLDGHVELSMKAKGEKVDLVIWPETMVPAQLNLVFDNDFRMRLLASEKEIHHTLAEEFLAIRKAIERTCRETNAHVLFGAETLLLPSERRTNSAYLFSPEAKELARYDKISLVVFGEYTPLAETFPFLKKMRPAVMGPDLSPGKVRRLFELPTRDGMPAHKFGVTICYEDSEANLFRKFVRDGADFMVNITNDGWFEDSSELDLHMAVCVFRAVENRVSIARCANTGVSAFISPTGRILSQIEDEKGNRRMVRGSLLGNLRAEARPTFYTRHGDVFAYMCLAAVLGLIVAAFAKKAKKDTAEEDAAQA